MKKEYGSALRSNFKKMIEENLPQFSEIKTQSLLVAPGERVYQWTVSETLFCFVILVPDPHGNDTFTVEIGWSKKSRFPQLSMKPSLERPSDMETTFALEEYICRLSEISTNRDKWWNIGKKTDTLNLHNYINFLEQSIKKVSKEEADTDVRDSVSEVVELLIKTGIPYLEKFIATQK